MMGKIFASIAVFAASVSLAATSVFAQPRKLEGSVAKQREAVAAWTKCIADERAEEVSAMLLLDFTSEEYNEKILELASARVSSECFNAMPRGYRKIELGGLPFAGGLAERLIVQNETPLLKRLSMAAIGGEAPTFSYTDTIAMCTVRGAPHLVANLFETPMNSKEEQAAAAQLVPVTAYCTPGERKLEATPFGLRSMLATASYRLLAIQKVESDA